MRRTARSMILMLAAALGGGCYMQHDMRPTSRDAGGTFEADAGTALSPSPHDGGSLEVDAAAPPSPLAECVAGGGPYADSDGSEPTGTVRVAFSYPRTSPEYEWGPFVASYLLERTAQLDALLETGAGLVEVPAWGRSYVVVGRDEVGAVFRLLTRSEAIERCPGFPSDG